MEADTHKHPEKQIGEYSYRQSEKLGKGTFGTVYKGRNVQTGDIVAIKVVDLNLIPNKESSIVDSLKKQVKVMDKLQSPHIVKMKNVYASQNAVYVILEFCEGGDLRKFLRNRKYDIPQMEAIAILRDIMDGFKELIQKGYIHRDIKPENVLISDDMYQLADFGLATKVDLQGQKLKDFVGSPLYMSPQILQKTEYTAQSDIWSLGFMFYQILFGKPPWPCRDVNSLLRNIYMMELRFPYEKIVSHETKDFIQKCLEIEESKRIGWDQIFRHPLISQSASLIASQPHIPHMYNLDDNLKQVLRSMQEFVSRGSQKVNDIFDEIDIDNNGVLDLQEFYLFIEKIDLRITFHQTKRLFKRIDDSKTGSITKEQFNRLFNSYDYSDLKDKAQHLIKEVREIIKTYQVNVKEIFDEVDINGDMQLQLQEFKIFINKIAPGIKQDEILLLFEKFDLNHDGTITFNQFQYVVMAGEDDYVIFNPYLEKSIKLLNEFLQILKKRKLNMESIFDNFDFNKTGFLDRRQIQYMFKIFDERIRNQEVRIIHKYFDLDGDGKVSKDDFIQSIEQIPAIFMYKFITESQLNTIDDIKDLQD